MRGMRTIGIGLAFALLIGATAAHAGWDDRSATDSFFIEGGGPGLLYSVNYEHIFENDFGFRGGFSYTSLSATAGSSSASASFIAVPIVLSYLGASSGNHALELGGGATLINASGAASGTGVAVLLRGVAGERDDGDACMARIGPQRAGDVQARAAPEEQVHHRHVGLVSGGQGDGFICVARLDAVDAVLQEPGHEHAPRDRIVVHDQHQQPTLLCRPHVPSECCAGRGM